VSAVEKPTLDGLDLPAVERFFASHVPRFTGRLSAELLQGGRSNLTFVLTDGRQRWVLRRPPLGGLTPSAHDMGREYQVVAALGGSGVPVARAVALAGPEVLGVPFSVVEHVDGRVIGYFKVAVIAEGIHARHLQGMTRGTGFDSVGEAVAPLAAAGLRALSHGLDGVPS
jgi:hypothetical protein